MKSLLFTLSFMPLFLLNDTTLVFEVKNNHQIKKLLIEFSDSSKVKEQLGNEVRIEEYSRNLKLISGECVYTSWYEMNYKELGLSIINRRRNNSSLSNICTITLKENCSWKIKGYQCRKTKFTDIKKERAYWIELTDSDDSKFSRFGKVSPYLSFLSPKLNKTFIDSLKLDYTNEIQMENYFANINIDQIVLSDNIEFLKRIKVKNKN